MNPNDITEPSSVRTLLSEDAAVSQGGNKV